MYPTSIAPATRFDYGVTTDHREVVVQLKETFLGETFWQAPEFSTITALFHRARSGVSFYGETKQRVGEKLSQLAGLPAFERLLALLSIFQELAISTEYTSLHGQAVTSAYNLKEQQRLKQVNQFIAEQYTRKIDIPEVAAVASLTESAFCRYFKRITHLTFTQFLNQYRISQAQKLLLLDYTVSEACFACGFESLSYFNRIFRRVTNENPLLFKKRHQVPVIFTHKQVNP